MDTHQGHTHWGHPVTSPFHRDTHPPGTSTDNTHPGTSIHPAETTAATWGHSPTRDTHPGTPLQLGTTPILSLTPTRVRAAPSCPVPKLLIHDPQGHWGIHPALSPCSLFLQDVLCLFKASLFPCPLLPQGVPIPVTMPPVSMGCPHPRAPWRPRVSPSPWGPHFHGPSPRVFPVPLVCTMYPLTSACCP